MEDTSRPGGSWAVQGCLFGSVALFAILLIVLVVLAYSRFREHTQEPQPEAPVGGWFLEEGTYARRAPAATVDG